MNTRLHQSWMLAGLLGLGVACGARTTTVELAGTEAAPAARGEANLWTDDNNNQRLELHVEQLARAPRLEGTPTTYAVWAETPAAERYLLGHLQVDDDDQAELTATIPAQQFRLRVTAEQTRTPAEPSDLTIMLTGFYETP